MAGIRLSVDNKRFKCNIELVDKVTVIVGDSGVGKTLFAKKLYQNFDDVEISNDYDIVILDTMMFKRWVKQASMFSEGRTLEEYWSAQSNLPAVRSVIIVDDDDIVKSREFDTFFEKSQDNYFLFINRAKFGSIQYNTNAVYKMMEQGIEHSLVSVYQTAKDKRVNIDIVLVEDSGSGYTFFKAMYKNKIVVNSSYELENGNVSGKDNIINVLRRLSKEFPGRSLLLLVDYAAFGSNLLDMAVILKTLKIKVYFYFKYQSFEYMLLKSNLIDDTGLSEFVCENILKYRSKERLYYDRLKELTADTEYKYSKSTKSFPVCYYKDCCSKARPINCKFINKASRQDKFTFLLSDTELGGLLGFR